MKRFFMLALIAVSTLVISCGKDKDESSIVGTWYLESSSVDGKVFPVDDCKKKTHVIFTDKTYNFVNYEENQQDECVEERGEKETYTISGNQIILKDGQGKVDTFTFSINGNTLTITSKEEVNGEEHVFISIFKKR